MAAAPSTAGLEALPASILAGISEEDLAEARSTFFGDAPSVLLWDSALSLNAASILHCLRMLVEDKPLAELKLWRFHWPDCEPALGNLESLVSGRVVAHEGGGGAETQTHSQTSAATLQAVLEEMRRRAPLWTSRTGQEALVCGRDPDVAVPNILFKLRQLVRAKVAVAQGGSRELRN